MRMRIMLNTHLRRGNERRCVFFLGRISTRADTQLRLGVRVRVTTSCKIGTIVGNWRFKVFRKNGG